MVLPIPGDAPHAERREKLRLDSGGHPNQAARFGLIRCDLGHQTRARQARRTGQAGFFADSPQQGVRRGERRTEQPRGAGEVEIGFVNRGHFDHRRELAEDGGDAVAPAGVEIVAAFEKNRMRAQLSRRAQRHGRMNAKAAGLITGRRDDAAGIGGAADDDRLAAKFGPLQQLDGDEERIHVHVQNRRHAVGERR